MRPYFAALRHRLLQDPDVLGVHVSPLAASVVIDCRDSVAFLQLNQCLEPRPSTSSFGAVASGQNPIKSAPIGLAGVLDPAPDGRWPPTSSGAQLIDWVLAAVVRAASDEARRIAAPRRPGLPPMLLVAHAE